MVIKPSYVIAYKSLVYTGRQNGVGMNSMCARVAGILAPLIRLLDDSHHTIPMLLYGIIPVFAGGFCLLLPETHNLKLQDQVEIKSADKPSESKELALLNGNSQ